MLSFLTLTIIPLFIITITIVVVVIIVDVHVVLLLLLLLLLIFLLLFLLLLLSSCCCCCCCVAVAVVLIIVIFTVFDVIRAILLFILSLPLYSDLITSSLESVVDQGIIGLEWTSMSAAGDLGPCLASTLVHLLRLSLENAMAPIVVRAVRSASPLLRHFSDHL